MALTMSLSKTYQGEHMVELFLKPILAVDDYTQNFRVMSNVVGKRNIYFRGRAAKIMKKVENCTFTEKGGISITDKEITTTNVGVQIKECWSTFKDTVFEKAWLKSGTDKHDMTGTEVEDIFIDFIQEGMRRDVARVLWFGDANAASADWDWFDGWLKCMLDNSGDLGYSTDISAFETGAALNTDAAVDIFEELEENAPSTLWQLGKENLRFYVSRGIVHNFAASLRGTIQTDSAFDTLVNGVKTLAWNGIPIVTLPELDADLADADNPIASSLNTGSNNIVILTTPENLVVALDGNNVMGNDARIWYSMDDDELKGRVNTMLGATCFLAELIAVAW